MSALTGESAATADTACSVATAVMASSDIDVPMAKLLSRRRRRSGPTGRFATRTAQLTDALPPTPRLETVGARIDAERRETEELRARDARERDLQVYHRYEQ
jgi:hypothetical protein